MICVGGPYILLNQVCPRAAFGLYLYLTLTGDLPVTEDTTTATFADDTAILAPDINPQTASQKLQSYLYLLQYSAVRSQHMNLIPIE